MSDQLLASRPYHYWKSRAALEALAGGEGTLRQRIMWALLSFAGLLEGELPEPFRESYLELQAQVTWKADGAPEEGTYANTLAAMSDEDAGKVADQIVKLFEQSVMEPKA